jgi:RNA polymerase sigma-70 factor (ECF subfamily)
VSVAANHFSASAGDSEAELIRRVQAGELDAFDRLVRRYLQRAFAVAYRVVWNRADAEDIVQEGFLAALDHIDGFDPGKPFGPWLSRIIVNRGLSLRAAQRRRSAEVIGEQLPAPEESPLLAVVQAETLARFRVALAELPDRQRMAFELHEVDGFAVEEIAEMLGVTPGTVRWHIHQARRQLRRLLEPAWREGGIAHA